MYRFYIKGIDNDYHYAELARVFLSDDDFEIIPVNSAPNQEILREGSYVLNASGDMDRDAIKRELYGILSEASGGQSKWGTLTGVRPLKPALDILDRVGSISEMKAELKRKYLISDEKANLLADIATYQRAHIEGNASDRFSVYAGIPFCPTRCEYCSFASNVADADAIERYLQYLLRETAYAGELAKNHAVKIDSIYVGGGTPTTLDAAQLGRLTEALYDAFGVSPGETEFTVEAGRPDTITRDRLECLKDMGVGRISINPQSMKNRTLELIGRRHDADDIRAAFALADEIGFDVINADLIAGLPEESAADFAASLDEIVKLGADNITVHTLSVKRGSRLHERSPEYYRQGVETVSEMIDYARDTLGREGYHPYYVYRQKHQMGALENVGYCKEGSHSIYNVRIMEDKQSIMGLGAGAVGKIYFPDEDRIERIANVSNYEIYCERFDEMLARKDKYFGG